MRRLARAALIIGGIAGGYWFWYRHRVQPDPTREEWGPGVTYLRIVRGSPALVLHLVIVDLAKARPSFVTTAGDPGRELAFLAQTVSGFAEKEKVDLAINGDFFEPWHTHGVFDYYPHVGDRCASYGLSVREGVTVCSGSRPGQANTVYLTDGRVSFTPPSGKYSALSGGWMLLHDGKVVPDPANEYHSTRHPRTAIGTDATGRVLYLAVADGRQPNFSEGIDLPELARVLASFGAKEAMNLDGGGSSALAARLNGRLDVVSWPIDKRIVGRERPVANHLGLRFPFALRR